MGKHLLTLLITLSLLAGCASQVKAEPFLREVASNSTKTELTIPEDIRTSLFDLAQEITPDYFMASQKKNQIFSPLSLWYALGVLREGASGETLKELDRMMKLKENFSSAQTIPELSKALNFKVPSLSTKDAVNGIQLTNGIFLEQRYRQDLKDQYLDDAARIWGTETAAVDFTRAAETRELIRDWVSRKTDGFINDYEATFAEDGSQLLNIYNVLHLKDQWMVPFNDLGKDTFQTSAGAVTVPFFGGLGHAEAYYSDEQVQAAAFSGETGLKVWFLLPREGLDPMELIPLLSGITSSRETAEVNLKAPRLDLDGDNVSLKDLLKAKGYEKLFQDADLEKILPDGDLAVGDIKQKSRIKMDEKGFEAAAVTEIGVGATAMPAQPVDLILDRPYLFVIVYDGLPLFISRVTDPS